MTWELEQLLRGPQAGDMLESALSSSGVGLQTWHLERVYTRPGNPGQPPEASARYRVKAADAEFTLVASTRRLQPQQRQELGAVRAESAAGTLHVWVHPTDPELPGLVVAEDHDALAARLEPLFQIPVHVAESQMLVLRPLRRAVYWLLIRSEWGQRTLFLKVVRPAKVALLLQRWAAAGLAPPIADAGEGLLVIEAAEGRPVTELLYRPTSPKPGLRIQPQAVSEALDSLRPEALKLPARRPPAARYRSFLPALVTAGADTQRLQTLAEAVDAELMASPGPVVPTHGDFHPANLFLTEGGEHPSALIDADTVGPGFRADDVAMFLAHLLALPSFDPVGYADVETLLDQLWEAAIMEHQRQDLSARVAACLISLAPGARSAEQLEHYIATAEALVHGDQSHMLSGRLPG